MFCGSADGYLFMLPPMTVYKSLNIYDNWTMGGPLDLFMPVQNQDGLTVSHLSSGSLRCSFLQQGT